MPFFNAAAAVLLLAASTMASPFPQAGNSPGSNMCDASSFNDGKTYQIKQAPVADCKGLIAMIDRDSTYSLDHSWSRPYTYGQCAFNVRVIQGAKPGLVGGADAVDLLTDSINKFTDGGYVAVRGDYEQVVSSEGEVDCKAWSSGGEKVRVQWVVADSGYNPTNN